ncbi:MAG: IS6 family transposase [Candidatus Bathyarchaeota archaeon]|nr:IS6 family transposase [Candidatus Bathyarchaeota archaeon]
MGCKYCGSERIVKNGKVKGTQVYKCKNCGHRFFLNDNFTKMQSKKRIIAAALNFYYDGLSLRKAQRNLEQIFGEHISQVTILNWIKKYSQLVKVYVEKQTPQLSGLWHEDETMLGCEGRNIWFWEMMDEDTKFMVASHISETRTFNDTVAIFEKGLQQSKERPKAVFVDGCNAYNAAFNRVFYSRYKAERVELVQRVGIRARETNNSIERLHGTLKDRTRCMRGLHSYESTKMLLEGWAVYYNCVRPHQSLHNRTPAQAAGMNVPNTWLELIEEATKDATGTQGEVEAKQGVDPFIDIIQIEAND